jgi:hypothetical protein
MVWVVWLFCSGMGKSEPTYVGCYDGVASGVSRITLHEGDEVSISTPGDRWSELVAYWAVRENGW